MASIVEVYLIMGVLMQELSSYQLLLGFFTAKKPPLTSKVPFSNNSLVRDLVHDSRRCTCLIVPLFRRWIFNIIHGKVIGYAVISLSSKCAIEAIT